MTFHLTRAPRKSPSSYGPEYTKPAQYTGSA